jgi:hypothetical protein
VHICYIDEAGGCEDPASSFSATPVMAIIGLIVDAASVPAMTRDFLALKRRYFPGRFTKGHALDHILVEVKGNEVLQMSRSSSRNLRRQAQRLRSDLLDLAESHGCRLIGRVWIKTPGTGMDPTAVYCYSVQDITMHFSQVLSGLPDTGVVIADGRTHSTNLRVAHSIFTQKWRTAGDPYLPVQEVPLFAASDNHAGLQLADLLASTLVFPMAAAGYPPKPGTRNVHCSPRYRDVQGDFGARLRTLQYRYRDETGKWRGGLVVSDPGGRRSGSWLFVPPPP